jgi:hypothetical protein
MLAWTIYISFLGVLLVLLPKISVQAARIIAMLAAIGGLVVTVAAFLRQENGAITTVARIPWIPSLGIEYHLAVDGISLTLLLLTGIVAVAGILFSWNIEHRANEFFAFYLALIGGVYGVFLSFDLFLLFVFYEIAIIPKYFLIAIWGSTRREYAAMKLALYSFVGSAMVLALPNVGISIGICGLCNLSRPVALPYLGSYRSRRCANCSFHAARWRCNEARSIRLFASRHDAISSRNGPVGISCTRIQLVARYIRPARTYRNRLRCDGCPRAE